MSRQWIMVVGSARVIRETGMRCGGVTPVIAKEEMTPSPNR